MATDTPNVLLIMSDDVGWYDVSAYNQLPYLTGESDESPRHEFPYS
jgi:arylsulfatase A-like enzyme